MADVEPDVRALDPDQRVQGVGAASVMVIPRAIIRDLHTGIEATRLMSLVMLVLSTRYVPAGHAGLVER